MYALARGNRPPPQALRPEPLGAVLVSDLEPRLAALGPASGGGYRGRGRSLTSREPFQQAVGEVAHRLDALGALLVDVFWPACRVGGLSRLVHLPAHVGRTSLYVSLNGG